jgi:adhesin transport system membrane fusion protein
MSFLKQLFSKTSEPKAMNTPGGRARPQSSSWLDRFLNRYLIADQAGGHEGVKGLRLSVWGGLLAVVIFTTWAAFAEIDQITRGQGQIIASSRTQIIQAADGGVLEELLVREGDEVQRGELLARLDKTKAEAGWRESRAKVAALSATVSRLKAEVFERDLSFESDVADFPEFRRNQIDRLRKRRDVTIV